MGKKSKRAAATSGTSSARPQPDLANAGSSAAYELLLGCGSDDGINGRLAELLESIKCGQVLDRLKRAGYSEAVAQRACLEVHQAKREVTYDSALKWIRRHDITKIDRPLQPFELLKYLSEIVVGLVERLPKADHTQLQHQLQRQLTAGDLRSSSEPASSSGSGRGASVSSASGSGGCSEGVVTKAALSGRGGPGQTSVSVAVASAVAALRSPQGQQLLLHPQWQALLATEDDVLTKLTSAGAAESDLQALLQELGVSDHPSASTNASTAMGAAADAGSNVGSGVAEAASDVQPAMAPPDEAGAANSSGADAPQQQEQQHVAAPVMAVDAAAGTVSAAGSVGGFTGRVAQQMLGLQQQVSKAMQSLASLRRSSSSVSGVSSTSGSSKTDGVAAEPDAVAAAEEAQQAPSMTAGHNSQSAGSDGGAGVAGMQPSSAAGLQVLPTNLSAEQRALILEQLSKQQLIPGQLPSLRVLLGPGRGVEVCTADEYKELNSCEDAGLQTLQTIDIQLLGLTEPVAANATGAGDGQELGSCTAAAASSSAAAPVADKPQTLEEELASLRQHREWADLRIAQLVRRVGEAERPVREEAAKLLQEVQALRVEKEGMKLKLRELERSISKIKESTYVEAAQKREYERAAAEAAAELQAARLRESEAAAEARVLQKQLTQERKRREAAEARGKKSAAEAADAATAAAAAAAREELALVQAQLRQQQAMLEQQHSAVAAAEATAAEALGRARAEAAQERSKCEVLAAEKASLVAALEAAEHGRRCTVAEAEEERRVLQAQLAAAEQRAQQAAATAQGLKQQLEAARAEVAAAAQRAAAAETRAVATAAAADAAQQQVSIQHKQQQHVIRVLASPASGGSKHTSGSELRLSSPLLPHAALLSTENSLFAGGGSGLWGGGGLFSGGPLDSPAVHSPAPMAPGPLSASMGSSSPLSQSGAATPQHSMHSSSIANSPVAPRPGSIAPPNTHFIQASLLPSGGGGNGSLFASLPQPGAPTAPAFAGQESSLFGSASGSSGMVLPDSSTIWGAALGAPSLGGATQQHHLPNFPSNAVPSGLTHYAST